MNSLENVDMHINTFGITNISLAPDILGSSVLACTFDQEIAIAKLRNQHKIVHLVYASVI